MSVLLQGEGFQGVSQREIAQQIQAKNKCREKLPTWFDAPQIYYPDKRNIEQCSSERTASYKADLIEGDSLLDLSGGLGVDSYYFSKKVQRVTHCETDAALSEIAAHNFKVLGRENISCLPADGIEILRDRPGAHHWVYADPSRRNEIKGKVFLLRDCLPDIPSHLEMILEATDRMLIKCSPMLDIKGGISELAFVREVHVVALMGEVKELLFVLEKGYEGPVGVRTVNMLRQGEQRFDFGLGSESVAQVEYGLPEAYLYEPNAAILKAGGFKSIAGAHALKKLHPHSHLYTGAGAVDFPGRRFRVEAFLPYSKKAVRGLGIERANLAIRNFPESVATLRKKHGLADGGDHYLFFSTGPSGELLLISCKKA